MPSFFLFYPLNCLHIFFGNGFNEITQFHQARLYFYQLLNRVEAANISISNADFVNLINFFTKRVYQFFLRLRTRAENISSLFSCSINVQVLFYYITMKRFFYTTNVSLFKRTLIQQKSEDKCSNDNL